MADTIAGSFLESYDGVRRLKDAIEDRRRADALYADQEAIRNARGEVPELPASVTQPPTPEQIALRPVPVSVGAVPQPGQIERRALADTNQPDGSMPVGGAAPREPQRQMLGVGDAFTPSPKGDTNVPSAGIGKPALDTGERQVALPAEPVQRAAGGDTQGAPAAEPRPRTMPVKQFQSLRQMNADLEAKKAEALKRGRPDLALKFHTEGMKLRDQLRTEVGDFYRTRYEMTRDPNVLLPFLNEFVGEGTTVKSIRRIDGPNGASFQVVGDDDGTPFDQTMSASDMTGFIRKITDPAGQRALEAEQAKKYYELQTEIAKEKAKNPFVKVAPGETIIPNDGSGRTWTAPKDPSKYHYETDKDSGRVTGIFDGDRKLWESDPAISTLPKAVRELDNQVQGRIAQIFGADQISKLLPEHRPAAIQALDWASRVITANHDQPWFADLGHGTIAKIATDIQSGKLQPRMKVINGREVPVEVEFNGQRIPLISARRLQEMQGGAGTATPTMRPKDGTQQAAAPGLRPVSTGGARPLPKSSDEIVETPNGRFRIKDPKGNPNDPNNWERV